MAVGAAGLEKKKQQKGGGCAVPQGRQEADGVWAAVEVEDGDGGAAAGVGPRVNKKRA